MTHNLSRILAITALALAAPHTVLANLNTVLVLANNSSVNLDTGAVTSSGGDVQWSAAAGITPQGAAKVANSRATGITTFSVSFEAVFDAEARSATTRPIAANLLVPGDIFVALTNSNHTSAVLVTAIDANNITLRVRTFGVTPTTPAITDILNNSSQIPMDFPNYGIPPSSIFIVAGSNLADPGAPVLQSSAAPGLPSTLNGASVTVVVNGVTTHPALYYTSPAQLAAVLPTNTPTGNGTLTVTYRGLASPPAPIHVVSSALGFNTYNANTAVATDAASGALITFTNSATPGEILVLWTTGLGANPADSDTTAAGAPHAIDTPLQILVGGVPAAIVYQGASAYPGVNQINVTLPSSVPSGCWVSIVAITSTVSNLATLPIKSGGGACVDELSGLTGDAYAGTGGRQLKAGLVDIVQTNTPDNRNGGRMVNTSANAAFVKYTGLYTPANSLSPGGCIVKQGVMPLPVPGVTGLDTGGITLTPPSGAAVNMSGAGIKGVFFSNLGTSGLGPGGGTFTFKTAGGADVGPFTATVSFANPLIVVANPSALASIDRSQPLTVSWSGGNPGTYVYITGTSTSSPLGILASFTCMAPADAGQFTVPSYVLSALPPGTGGTGVQNSFFTPISVTGVDVAVAGGDVSYSTPSTFR